MPTWLDGLRAKVFGGGATAVHLGAFGKHPGWDDHVEPINLDSEPLLAARDILYVRGIGGVINAALWEKKPEETRPGIAHVFSWNGEHDTILGRMWSSVDGKGRTHYPMVAVAHLGVPFSYTLVMRAARVLAGVETRCRAADTAAEVRAIFAAAQDELRASLAQPPDWLGAEPDGPACAQLAKGMWLGEGETFARVLYTITGQMQAFAREPKSVTGKISLKMLESTVAAQQSRLPADPDDSFGSIAFWQKVVAATGARRPLMLFFHPVGGHWLDLIFGVPTPQQLYCIRANETALPPASAVPYELDPAFRDSAGELLARMCNGAPHAR